MQHTEENTEQHTEQHSTLAQPQRTEQSTGAAQYSFDIYHEQIAINNSNTIELYTISN